MLEPIKTATVLYFYDLTTADSDTSFHFMTLLEPELEFEKLPEGTEVHGVVAH